MVEVEIKKWGNSLGVILPQEKLKEYGLDKGDIIDIDIIKKQRINGFGVCKGKKPYDEEKESHNEFW